MPLEPVTLSELLWRHQTQDGFERGMTSAVLSSEDPYSALVDRSFLTRQTW